jgi:hypothetical protein
VRWSTKHPAADFASSKQELGKEHHRHSQGEEESDFARFRYRAKKKEALGSSGICGSRFERYGITGFGLMWNNQMPKFGARLCPPMPLRFPYLLPAQTDRRSVLDTNILALRSTRVETQQAIPLFGHFSNNQVRTVAVAVAVVVGVVLSLFLARTFALLVLLVLLVLFHLLSSLGGREVHYRHLLDCWAKIGTQRRSILLEGTPP